MYSRGKEQLRDLSRWRINWLAPLYSFISFVIIFPYIPNILKFWSFYIAGKWASLVWKLTDSKHLLSLSFFFYYPSLFLVKTPNLSFLYSCKKITTFSQFQEESQPLLPLESLTTVEGLMHVILLSVDWLDNSRFLLCFLIFCYLLLIL